MSSKIWKTDRGERRLNSRVKNKIKPRCSNLLYCVVRLFLSQSRVKHSEEMSQERWPAYVVCSPFNLAVSHSHLSDHCLDVHKCVCVRVCECILTWAIVCFTPGFVLTLHKCTGRRIKPLTSMLLFVFLTASPPHTNANPLQATGTQHPQTHTRQ